MEDRFTLFTAMVKTGVTLLDILTLLVILLPLGPVFIIFLRKSYNYEALNFLGALCILSFIQYLLLLLPLSLQLERPSIKALFSLFEFAALVLLFRSTFAKNFVRETLSVLLFSFLSVVITLYTIIGINENAWSIAMLINTALVAMTLVALVRLIRNDNLVLFNSPIFWIAAGTLCYYSMCVLTETVTFYRWDVSGNPEEQKAILLCIANLARFAAYTVAAWIARVSRENY